jgi:UPF0271 protein
MTNLAVDLNADLGEGYEDEAILPFLSSCNIACGGHAGDAKTMKATLSAAKRLGVGCGAHPGFPDPKNFGRKEMPLTLSELAETVTEQITALSLAASALGVALTHVKPHGALYHACNRRRDTARTLVDVVARRNPKLVVVGFAGSPFLDEARKAGLNVAGEAFADRLYLEDGTLAPRGTPGAVVSDPARAAAQAISIVKEGVVVSSSGSLLPVQARTICVHGDTPGAVELAKAVREALEKAGVGIRSLGR